ncbi:hypothetical protein IQ13_4148 [Lacibacter cauensis]|uniref:Uncharacterized protein n=1 Tax=Lacibacter cauensis TaxID=510947 RepID=A0A562S993_9BACT|nr:hypothetical protein [Lacibacter cauensis]TWI77908.1 hypothetical protein IQ13_4148 [Lacibacter cauensis]
MNRLLEQTIHAHGGLDKWNTIQQVKLRATIDGLLWKLKGQPTLLRDTYVVVDTKQQAVRYKPVNEKWYTSFEPNRVAAFAQNNCLEELQDPRQSFANHSKETKWTRLQTFYFASYAMWNYINIPYVFADPAYQIKAIGTWQENNEEWQRLQVQFPGHVATHAPVQTFYIDQSGLIRRHDYDVAIIGNGRSAHYLYAYQDINGIKIPTQRRVFTRLENNTARQPEPLLVAIDLTEIVLTVE